MHTPPALISLGINVKQLLPVSEENRFFFLLFLQRNILFGVVVHIIMLMWLPLHSLEWSTSLSGRIGTEKADCIYLNVVINLLNANAAKSHSLCWKESKTIFSEIKKQKNPPIDLKQKLRVPSSFGLCTFGRRAAGADVLYHNLNTRLKFFLQLSAWPCNSSTFCYLPVQLKRTYDHQVPAKN